MPLERYERGTPPGYVPSGVSVKLVGAATSSPTSSSAPLSSTRGGSFIGQFGQNLSSNNQVQTQPLDLGMSSNKIDHSQAVSPKRKASTPVSQIGDSSNPVCLEVKKRRIDGPSPTVSQSNLTIYPPQTQHQPQLSRVSEPSALIASAATTITTVVNTAAYRTPTTSVTSLITQSNPTTLSENLPDVSVTTVTVDPIVRPSSTGTDQLNNSKPPTPNVPQSASPAPASTASTPTPPTSVTPGPSEEPPGTPVKMALTPSVVDSEKSNSPGPQKSSSSGSYPVRHLKKAWLQRHTGEDLEDTTGLVGSGSCVTLPMNIKTTTSAVTPVKDSPVNSIHSVGSMAVNSINKTKHFSNKSSVNRKVVAKESVVNGDTKNADDSSSSDQERGRKSPPKRKPPKVKRKKGGGPGVKKTVADEKKRKSGQQTPAAGSESGSDSEKESGSEKDSDSGESNSAAGKKSGKFQF